MISPTEAKILSLLLDRPKGAFASELVHASGGQIKRGSVYTTLSRMEEAGAVSSREVPPSETHALPRKLYMITKAGRQAREAFGVYTGFLSGPAAAVAAA